MESGTALRLAAQLPQNSHPMGMPHRELSRLCPTSLPQTYAEAFMRPLLEPGHHINGPPVAEEMDSNTLIRTDFQADVGTFGNPIITCNTAAAT
jgi:hypothetical protein